MQKGAELKKLVPLRCVLQNIKLKAVTFYSIIALLACHVNAFYLTNLSGDGISASGSLPSK